MRAIKIKVKDYQAIKNAELNITEGLTAIVGPTNSGKSSLIRAVRGAINNQTGSGFINYDAEETVVIIENEGNEIIWTKPKRGPASYTLNGSEITKIGSTQNEEVAQLLNMPEIEVNNTKIRLNFWEQMEKAFLMDKTPNQLFNFISRSKEQEVMTHYQDLKQKHQRELDADVKEKETRLDIVQEDIHNLTNRVQELDKYNAINLNVVEHLQQIKESLTNDLNVVVESQKSIDKYKNQVKTTQEKVQQVEELKSDIDNLIENQQFLKESVVKYNVTQEERDRYLRESKNLEKTITALESKTKGLKHIITQHSEYSDLKLRVIKSFDTLLEAERELSNLKKIKEQREITIEEVENKLNEFEVCPFCGSELGGCNE